MDNLHSGGIIRLPTEIWQEIFTYLDGPELIMCSYLCKIFWHAINYNRIWQRICHHLSRTYVIDFLMTTPSTVEPVFALPKSLWIFCEWRQVYEKLLHLKENFSNGKYTTHSVTSVESDYININDVKLGDDILVIPNKRCSECQIWCIRTVPRFIGTIKCRNNTRSTLYVYKNTIIIVNSTLFQVYKVVNSKISFQYRQRFDANNLTSHSLKHYQPNIKNLPEMIVSCYSGKYFVGFTRRLTSNMLHLWDIETGNKIIRKNILMPFAAGNRAPWSPQLDGLDLIAPRTYSGEILVLIEVGYYVSESNYTRTKRIKYLLCSFNIKSFQFRILFSLNFLLKSMVYFEKNMIVTVVDKECTTLVVHNEVFAEPTKIRKSKKQIKYPFHFTDIKVLNNIIAYITGGTLYVCDNNLTNYLKMQLSVDDFVLRASYILCDWNFVLVSRCNPDKTVKSIELYECKNKRCSNLKYNGTALGTNSPLKIFVTERNVEGYTINMLQFW